MIKVVTLLLVTLINLYAECLCEEQKSDAALGVILSYGEGMGISYRINFENSYLQNAGFAAINRDGAEEYIWANYALSYGHYLFSSKSDYFHFKNVVGIQANYEKDPSGSDDVDIYKYGTLGGGFGFELGKRARGNLMYGIDALYIFVYDSEGKYSLSPSLGVYAHYNF